MDQKITCMLILCMSLLVGQTLAFGGKNVLELTSDFNEKVADGRVYLVKMYAPWCGHCKKLVPTWAKLGDTFKDDDKIVIAHIDCTKQKDICAEHGVRGYPTLKVFHGGKEHVAYKGARDLSSLKEFVVKTKEELLSETTA